MINGSKIPVALLTLRLGVFVVMLMWTLDKFVNPGHAANVFESFYFMGGLGSTVMMIIGLVEVCIIGCFVLGYKKKYSYGAVLILHTISTLSSYKLYLDPLGKGLIFWAAFPMLAACYALYVLRDLDTKWTV